MHLLETNIILRNIPLQEQLMISIPPQKLRSLHKYYTQIKDRYTGHNLEGTSGSMNNIEKQSWLTDMGKYCDVPIIKDTVEETA